MKKYLTVVLLFSVLLIQAQSKTLKAGEAAPDFKLTNVDKKEVSFGNYPDAKGFIVVFTCNTCPYAIGYEKRIMELNKKFKPEGYPVIAINPNDPEASTADTFVKMQELAKAKKYDFPYLFDPGQIITDQYGAKRTPHLFVVSNSKSGAKIEYTGAIDNDPEGLKADKTKYVEDVITALKNNKKPSITETKEIGCTVKRKAKV